jgi:hypothetical protein
MNNVIINANVFIGRIDRICICKLIPLIEKLNIFILFLNRHHFYLFINIKNLTYTSKTSSIFKKHT